MNSVAEESLQLCCFKLGELHLGIDVLSVQEVIKERSLTPVPRAPEAVEGLLNLRGQIITAIDLRSRFNLPRSNEELPSKRLIIVDSAVSNAALLVDSVGEVVDVTSDTFEETTNNVPEEIQPFILGVHTLQGQILHVVDSVKVSSLGSETKI